MSDDHLERGWYEGADVCVAIIPAGQAVDWSPGGYAPPEQIWVPEGTFEWLLEQVEAAGAQLVARERLHLQTRLSPQDCANLLEIWETIEEAADPWGHIP